MPNEPQGRRGDGDGPDPTTFEEIADTGREPSDTDTEWLSIATADPAYLLKDPYTQSRRSRPGWGHTEDADERRLKA